MNDEVVEYKNIRFLRWYGPYQTGQWATFTAEQADNLIRAGRAVLHDPNKPSDVPPRRGVQSKMVTK